MITVITAMKDKKAIGQIFTLKPYTRPRAIAMRSRLLLKYPQQSYFVMRQYQPQP